jgi:hypothetical protein
MFNKENAKATILETATATFSDFDKEKMKILIGTMETARSFSILTEDEIYEILKMALDED